MSLESVLAATEAGKIDWRLHDALGMSRGGYWAHVIGESGGPEFRLDCVEGAYTLMRSGVLLEKADDVDGLLKAAIEEYVESTKSAVLDLFDTELSKIKTKTEQVEEFEEAL